MNEFKVGDKVKCIDDLRSNNCLLNNNIYTIKKIKSDTMVYLEETPDNEYWFNSRFELISSQSIYAPNPWFTQSPSKSINQILARENCKRDLQKDFNDYKQMYNLSQDEIDAIILEIKQEQNQLVLPNMTVPNYYPGGPYGATNNTPMPVTGIEWATGFEGELPPKTPLKAPCSHQMVPYVGLSETFNYCKKCGDKEK